MKDVLASQTERLVKRLAAEMPAEKLAVDSSKVGGGIATVPVQDVWVGAFSAVGWLAWLNNSFTRGGDPMVAYRIETFAGAAQGFKLWGQNLAPRDEAAAIVEGDPQFRSVTLNARKQGFWFELSKEALVDVHRLQETLTRACGYGLALDAALQVVNGNGSTQGNGLRTELVKSAWVNRRVPIGSGAPSPDMLEAAWKLVPAQARMDPTCAWLTSDANSQAVLKSTRETRYVQFTRRAEEIGADYELMGKPLFSTPGFTDFATAQAATMIFGPLSATAARYQVPPSIVFSEEGDAWASDQCRVKVEHRMDCNVIDPQSLAVLSGS